MEQLAGFGLAMAYKARDINTDRFTLTNRVETRIRI